MKILRITLLIIFVIFSCSKNEDSVNDGQNPNLDQQQNENRAIPLSELNSGIKIEGSTTILVIKKLFKVQDLQLSFLPMIILMGHTFYFKMLMEINLIIILKCLYLQFI